MKTNDLKFFRLQNYKLRGFKLTFFYTLNVQKHVTKIIFIKALFVLYESLTFAAQNFNEIN